jgi:histidyl-tRNA synthetase
MMAADTMEALGIARGSYVIKVNNRKILDGMLQVVGVDGPEFSDKRLTVLRAMDKLDKFGPEGVSLLLGKGRKDESGDFTKGAELGPLQIDMVMKVLLNSPFTDHGLSNAIQAPEFQNNEIYAAGFAELQTMNKIFYEAGYKSDRIKIDPSIVRGLEYYTGPVFECELLMDTLDDDGKPVRFGSVGGGGRYDDLVARFTGAQVPATGFSIGVSRLYSALKLAGLAEISNVLPPVVVTVMDKDRQADYWKMVQVLRAAGVRAEMYVGTSNMGKQMKYADKRNAPLVIIQGPDEKAQGLVQIKDLRRGSELAATIETREEYASQRLAQFSVPEADLVEAVKKALAR